MLGSRYRIGQATGVSIHLLPDGNVSIAVCSVAVNDNKLDIEKKHIDLNNLSDLEKLIQPRTLISLNLFGKGILRKQIAKVEEITAANFSQVLPNAIYDDFYVQHFVSGGQSFVSVIRKVEADKWIDAITDLGFDPLMLSLGPFLIQHILEQTNIYSESIVFDGHVIEQNERNEWINYSYQPEASAVFPIKIGAENINEKLLLAYAAAFQLALSPDVETVNAAADKLEKKHADFLDIRKIRVKGFVALCVFFVLLLVNFLVFSWLNSSNSMLSEQVSISARNVTDLKGIEDKVKTKEALLKTLGWDEEVNKAALVDQLASLLPEEIRLLEISVNPIDAAATRMQKSLAFSDRKIKITGSSENIMPVNEWMARAKTLNWVKATQMESYVFNTELGAGRFIITISY